MAPVLPLMTMLPENLVRVSRMVDDPNFNIGTGLIMALKNIGNLMVNNCGRQLTTFDGAAFGSYDWILGSRI
jgi:hypothetical protein